MNELRNKGQFSIRRKDALNYDLMKHIQRDMVVYRTQEDYMRDSVTFEAEGDMFKPIQETCVAPEYEVKITEGEHGGIMVEFIVKAGL